LHDELLHGAERLCEWRDAVGAVVVVEVDVIGTQPFERGVDRPPNVLGEASPFQPNLVAMTTCSRRASRISPRKRSLSPPLP
jgi:hypothetical protein